MSGVQVACPRGNVNGSHPLVHRLTVGEAERVIYALTAGYADELTEPDGDRIWAGHDTWDQMPCPLEVIRWGHDGEMYAEHVESMTDQRRRGPVAAVPA